MKKAHNIKISYEPEADVLSWELSKKPIDYAKEADSMVVHFSKDNVPVFVEILEASKFLSEVGNLMRKKARVYFREPALVG